MDMDLAIFDINADCGEKFKLSVKLNVRNLTVDASFDAPELAGEFWRCPFDKKFMARVAE